jgi:hypothetical protein
VSYDLVEVIWHDAFAYKDSWISAADIDEEPMVVHSVGYLLQNAKPDHVVITQSVNAEDIYDGVLSIPCAMVRILRVVSSTDRVPFSPASA